MSIPILVGQTGGYGSPTMTPPTGIQAGDVAFLGLSTRNTNPGTPTGGWRLLHQFDTSSSEWLKTYWRICDGTEKSWYVAGGTMAVGVGVYRPKVPVSHCKEYTAEDTYTMPSAYIPKDGFALVAHLQPYQATTSYTYGPNVIRDLRYASGDVEVIIGRFPQREEHWTPAFAWTGAQSSYHSARVAVFYPAVRGQVDNDVRSISSSAAR
jgi:hypothetical protein